MCSPCQITQWTSSINRPAIKENCYVLLMSSITAVGTCAENGVRNILECESAVTVGAKWDQQSHSVKPA